MALHWTPAEHDANPPSSWLVVKSGSRWNLTMTDGTVIDGFTTKRDAEAARVDGFAARLYAKEGRWFAGEQVPGWKQYATTTAVAL